MDQTQVLQLRNVFFSFIGYLQQCLQRINVYFVSIPVLLYRIRSFFHLILLSYFIDFVSFRYILFSDFTDFVASFLWISFSYFTDFVSFRWISFSYFTDFVGFCFRFVSFRFSVYRYPCAGPHEEKKTKSTFYIVLSLINLDLITIFSTLFKKKII